MLTPPWPLTTVYSAQQAVTADRDAGVRKASEVVHMQDGAVHHQAACSDGYAPGAGVHIHAMVEIGSRAQLEVVGKAQPRPDSMAARSAGSSR